MAVIIVRISHGRTIWESDTILTTFRQNTLRNGIPLVVAVDNVVHPRMNKTKPNYEINRSIICAFQLALGFVNYYFNLLCPKIGSLLYKLNN